MFETGTRIMILASSRRKGPGPRKGSVGYVSTTRQFDYFQNFTASLHEVFFTRYGFEETRRIERKPVICAFPILKEGEDTPLQVKSFIRRVISPKHEKDWNSVRASFDVNASVPIAVAVPDNVNKIDITEAPDNEFKAWTHSINYNQRIIHRIHEALMRGHFVNSKDSRICEENLELLRAMGSDRDFRDVTLSDITATKQRKELFVSTVRMLMSVLLGGVNNDTEMKLIAHGVMAAFGISSKDDKVQRLYSSLAASMFRPQALFVAEQVIESKGDEDFKKQMKVVKQTRDELLRLSSRLEVAE